MRRRLSLVASLRQKVREIRAKLWNTRTMLRKYREKYGDWLLEKKELKRQSQHKYYITPKPARGSVSFRRLTVAGGYDLAIKRSFGHTGADASLGHLQPGLTRQRAVAWEHILVANLVVQALAFFHNAYAFLVWAHQHLMEELAAGKARTLRLMGEGTPNGLRRHFAYEILTVRADGTHTHCAEGAKAHSMEVRVIFSFGKCLEYVMALTDEELDAFELAYCPGDYVVDLKCIPDIVKVPEPCDGHVSRNLFLKQVSSLGIRPWTCPVLEDVPTLGFNACSIQEFDPDAVLLFHIVVYVFGTDNGGDQQGQDLELDIDFELELFKIKFRNWCFMHQLHLIAKRQLEKLGKKYFSTLAKIIHIWRTGQNHKKLKAICQEVTMYTDPGLAERAFRRLPQTPLRGRWLAVTGAERAILVLGMVLYVLFIELSKQKKAAQKQPPKKQILDASKATKDASASSGASGFLGADPGGPGDDDGEYQEKKANGSMMQSRCCV